MFLPKVNKQNVSYRLESFLTQSYCRILWSSIFPKESINIFDSFLRDIQQGKKILKYLISHAQPSSNLSRMFLDHLRGTAILPLEGLNHIKGAGVFLPQHQRKDASKIDASIWLWLNGSSPQQISTNLLRGWSI